MTVPVGLVITDRVPPSSSITAPGSGSTQQGTVNVVAAASDNDQIAGVKLYVDGSQQGAEITTPPYQVGVNTAALSSGGHSSYAVVRDRIGNVSQSPTISWNAKDQHPPGGSITNPPNGGTVYDTVTFRCAPNDDVGVSYVQFNVDGSGWTGAIGYDWSWNYDTHNLGVGWHTIYCMITDTTGNQTQISSSFYVNNSPPGGGYLDLGQFVAQGDGGVYADRWSYGFYPDFHGGNWGWMQPGNGYMPGNPNPTYYQMQAYMSGMRVENPEPGTHAYVGLWINANPDGNGNPGPNYQMTADDSTSTPSTGWFNISGGEYMRCERWADNWDGGYTQGIHINYRFVPKYAS